MRTIKGKNRPECVAVYGTLKRGFENSHVLDSALFLGTDSLDSILLYDLGAYPGAKRGKSDGIEVEIYAVAREILQALDQLEEYDLEYPRSGLYRREIIPTAFGDAWIYLFNRSVAGRRPLRRGSWRPRHNAVAGRSIASTGTAGEHST